MKKLIYKFLEFFYKNGIQTTVSGVSIKLPFRFYRYYEKDYESDNILFFKQTIKPNDTVLDIGAQIGLMTKLFTDLTGPNGKVYAFEPTPYTYSVLKTTLHLNGIEKIAFPFQEAVSDKKGKAIFNISNVDIDAANSLSNLKRNRDVSGIEVNVTSIDSFVKEQFISKVNFIKIDAEGAEYYVLLGATDTMTRHRPIINLALHPLALSNFNSSLKEIYDFVKQKNYELVYKFKTMGEAEFVTQTNLFDVQLIPMKG